MFYQCYTDKKSQHRLYCVFDTQGRCIIKLEVMQQHLQSDEEQLLNQGWVALPPLTLEAAQYKRMREYSYN